MQMQRIFGVVVTTGLVGLAACGGPSGPGKLVAREKPAHRPAAVAIPNPGPELRFYGVGPEEEPQDTPPPADDLASLLDYDLPEGWERIAPTTFRFVNVRPVGSPDVECYISLLPSDGGGVVANVNRWRSQMGLAGLGPAEVDALPTRPLLAGSGVFVDCEGSFTGMGGPARDGWRLMGVIVPIPGQTLFVKMTGPADVLETEAPNFEAFCDSIRPSARAAEMAGQQPAPPPQGRNSHGLTWSPPDGWVEGPSRSMRLVTFELATRTECYLSLARGERLLNYNRWREQVGQPPISAADLAALETVDVLGEACPVLEATGEFTGMTGGPRPDTTVLATMRALGQDALFVKMVGPAEEVAAARADFDAFCASIGQE